MRGTPVTSPPKLMQRRTRDLHGWQGERLVDPETGKLDEICCEWPSCLKSLEDPETGVFAGIKMYGVPFCGRAHGDNYFHFYKISACSGPLEHLDEESTQTVRMRRSSGIIPGEVRDLIEEMQMGSKRRIVHGNEMGTPAPCSSPASRMEEDADDDESQ